MKHEVIINDKLILSWPLKLSNIINIRPYINTYKSKIEMNIVNMFHYYIYLRNDNYKHIYQKTIVNNKIEKLRKSVAHNFNGRWFVINYKAVPIIAINRKLIDDDLPLAKHMFKYKKQYFFSIKLAI